MSKVVVVGQGYVGLPVAVRAAYSRRPGQRSLLRVLDRPLLAGERHRPRVDRALRVQGEPLQLDRPHRQHPDHPLLHGRGRG